jgi:hypothetical protein
MTTEGMWAAGREEAFSRASALIAPLHKRVGWAHFAACFISGTLLAVNQAEDETDAGSMRCLL